MTLLIVAAAAAKKKFCGLFENNVLLLGIVQRSESSVYPHQVDGGKTTNWFYVYKEGIMQLELPLNLKKLHTTIINKLINIDS